MRELGRTFWVEENLVGREDENKCNTRQQKLGDPLPTLGVFAASPTTR